jgi:hypothetical protein
MVVHRVRVPARRVGLPNLDQRAGDRVPVAIEQPAGDDDSLAERLARVLGRPVTSVSQCGSATSGRPGARSSLARYPGKSSGGCSPRGRSYDGSVNPRTSGV